MALKADELNSGRGAMASLACTVARLALQSTTSMPSRAPLSEHLDLSALQRRPCSEEPKGPNFDLNRPSGSEQGPYGPSRVEGGADAPLALEQLHSCISRVEALEKRIEGKLDILDRLVGRLEAIEPLLRNNLH